MLFQAVFLFVTGLVAVNTRAPTHLSLVLPVLWVVSVRTILVSVVPSFVGGTGFLYGCAYCIRRIAFPCC